MSSPVQSKCAEIQRQSLLGSEDRFGFRGHPCASELLFLLSADATSGDIRTNLPVMIEEQGKHSLRAHVGNSTGRVEVHTVSGGINVRSGS